LVYDVTDINSFNKLDKWMGEFKDNTKLQFQDNFPFVILGNKSDLTEKR